MSAVTLKATKKRTSREGSEGPIATYSPYLRDLVYQL
jgi:hypothetical protein